MSCELKVIPQTPQKKKINKTIEHTVTLHVHHILSQNEE